MAKRNFYLSTYSFFCNNIRSEYCIANQSPTPQRNTSMLTPYPEVAGPIRVPTGDFIDQIEVAIVNSLNIGFIAKVVVSLLISVCKKVGAGPLPGIRIIV